MAQWVSRARTDGGQGIQIKWRIQGRWQCETFTESREAAQFRAAVEACGNGWPPGWIKGAGWAPPAELHDVVTLTGHRRIGHGEAQLPVAVYSELMSDEPPTAADAQDDEQRLPLPRHLAALVGALHGPADLGANHDAYLTYAPGQDRAEGAASA